MGFAGSQFEAENKFVKTKQLRPFFRIFKKQEYTNAKTQPAKKTKKLHQHRPQTAAAVGVCFLADPFLAPKQSDPTQRPDTTRANQHHISPASRRAMGKKVISAQYPDTPWETNGDTGTKGDKAKSSQPSVQTRHGRQGETKGDKAKSSQPSIQTCHGRQGGQRETKRDKGRQSKIISAQHPDTPWETKGDHRSLASRHAMGDKERQGETKQSGPSPASRHGRQGETKGQKLTRITNGVRPTKNTICQNGLRNHILHIDRFGDASTRVLADFAARLPLQKSNTKRQQM